MNKRIVFSTTVGILLLLSAFFVGSGVFARSNTYTPPSEFNQAATDYANLKADTAAVCTPTSNCAAAEAALEADGQAAVTTYGQDRYEQAFKDLGVGKDYCFFYGNYPDINSNTCTGVKPPPVVNCSGVIKGGLLSPYTNVTYGNGGALYLFKSLDCGSVWGSFDDMTGSHYITNVTIADQANSGVSQGAYLSNRNINPGDWTSTTMIGYIPGHQYCVDSFVDGQNLETCATV